MDLATGHVVIRPKWTPCKMTDMVIKRVEELAAEEEIKSCKFFDHKGRPMLPQPNDLQLKGV